MNGWCNKPVSIALSINKHPVNPLRANLTKWENTLKQFGDKLVTSCLSVFDHFVGLALKSLISSTHGDFTYQLSYCCRIWYGKYFPGFSYLTIFLRPFRRSIGNIRNEGNTCYIAQGCRTIFGYSLSQKYSLLQ